MFYRPRTVVITGAAGGIGRALTRRFVNAGDRVFAVERDAWRGAELACEFGQEVTSIQGDVSSSASCNDALALIVEAVGTVDILINNAAVLTYKPLAETTDEEWLQTLSVVLSGAFYMTRAALGAMRDHSNGRIINFSSAAGVRGLSNRGAYGAAKGGIGTLTKALAIELGPRGITANAVAPGPVETPLVASHTPEQRARWHRMLAVKRYADPAEIAALVHFLASAEAAFITGQIICPDGGFTAGVDLEAAQ